MIERTAYHIAFSKDWGRQMRFITGPRQSGKTTLAKLKLEKENIKKLYYLWDLRSVRNLYKENELFFTQDAYNPRKKLWVCFDEIHKMPKWKNIIKGIFDQTEDHYQFIITGSAKLNITRRAGDSLSGRYFTFHLFPLCLAEIKNAKIAAKNPPDNSLDFITQKLGNKPESKEHLSTLLEYGGFPEPFSRQSKKFHYKWTEDYLDKVINEDIGSLTRIVEKEYLYDLYRLLPEMIGNPISQNSLASHLESTIPTIKNYLRRLSDFYLAFKISPYSKNIKRALLKAPKVYLYDWTNINDKAKRFENYVACEIQTLIHFWMEATGKKYSLFYIRTKEKQEIDFLILKGNAPWLLIEAKYSNVPLAKHHFTISKALGNIPFVQVCREENIAVQHKKNIFRISASRLF